MPSRCCATETLDNGERLTPEHLEYLRALAHDLKTPLANLRWHAQLLARGVRDGRLEQQTLLDGLQAISLYANAAAAAIDEVHDLTRLEAGAPILLQRKTIDLAEFVRQVVGARVEPTRQRLEFDKEAAQLSVDVDSRQGVGSTFTILLPLEQPARATAAA